jgi:hypothetical protein
MKGATKMANEKKADKAESFNLADVAKQVEEMLAKAKAEAEKIVADAKASVSSELTEEQKKAIEDRKAYWNEYVEITLFKDNNKYRDDVPIGINGEICMVQRGKKVKIKRKYADVLENSNRQDFETSELIDRKSKEFAKSEF